jgi:hypothetical protein
VLKVVFKALGETVRLVQFSMPGYHQLLIDVKFLEWLIPHCFNNKFIGDGSKAHTALESVDGCNEYHQGLVGRLTPFLAA